MRSPRLHAFRLRLLGVIAPGIASIPTGLGCGGRVEADGLGDDTPDPIDAVGGTTGGTAGGSGGTISGPGGASGAAARGGASGASGIGGGGAAARGGAAGTGGASGAPGTGGASFGGSIAMDAGGPTPVDAAPVPVDATVGLLCVGAESRPPWFVDGGAADIGQWAECFDGSEIERFVQGPVPRGLGEPCGPGRILCPDPAGLGPYEVGCTSFSGAPFTVDGRACCYVLECHCCGRPLVVSGIARTARAVARTDWIAGAPP